MVPRKSATAHKIDAVFAEHGGSAARLKAKLAELDKEVKETNDSHEARVTEKTAILFKNIKYYGTKVQELIQELVYRQPYDQETGLQTTLTSTVKKLGIDTDKIKFSMKDEDFTPF